MYDFETNEAQSTDEGLKQGVQSFWLKPLQKQMTPETDLNEKEILQMDFTRTRPDDIKWTEMAQDNFRPPA